ncbi:hypothetical protein K678_05908 [Magnetospirillum fulvum MGU-K5]|uniref:DUF1007 family protein n=1 Tax=Magnetospirillum fulvum MGU-K5 TaxID=1316936 RepID=S9TJG2_MAGFU|nr:hypothetical protein K678_05908 [Magnetospirillum fulvum MGU-K5]
MLAMMLGGIRAASAHPHAWIDMSVEVLFDMSGKVTALKQSWLFDEFYTADTVQKGEQAKMDLLTTRILGNLKDWGYFTQVQAGSRSIGFMRPTEHSARMEKHRLRMTFVLPLAEAVSPTDVPLTYWVFDPTYYIEMLHAESKDAIRLTGAPPSCRFTLIQPAPDPKAVAKAAALDRTQSGGDGLGKQFAEKVEIRCDAQP